MARIPIQHEENRNDPPSKVTPQEAAVTYMMHRSHTFQRAMYMRKTRPMSISLMQALHAMIFHSLSHSKKQVHTCGSF